MQFSWPIFATVLLLGVVQLAVGVVFGRCLPVHWRNTRRPDGRHVETGQLAHAAARLQESVRQVADRVGRHRTQIEQVSRTLGAAETGDPDGLRKFVLATVAQLVDINEQLQSRLRAAERRLQEQAERIEALYAAQRAGRGCGSFHNGVTGRQTGLPAPPDAELQEICDDLRQRVEEVVQGPLVPRG